MQWTGQLPTVNLEAATSLFQLPSLCHSTLTTVRSKSHTWGKTGATSALALKTGSPGSISKANRWWHPQDKWWNIQGCQWNWALRTDRPKWGGPFYLCPYHQSPQRSHRETERNRKTLNIEMTLLRGLSTLPYR